MQIVIDIPNSTFTDLKKKQNRTEVDVAVLNGTPLPKGHGRLIDADRLETHFIGTEQGTDLEVYLEPTIINAPTVIEAESEGEK